MKSDKAKTMARSTLRLFLLGVLWLSGCSFDPGVERPATNNAQSDLGIADQSADIPQADLSSDLNRPTDMTEPDLPTMADMTDMPDPVDMPPDSGSDTKFCDGMFVNTKFSNEHCGACGNACDPVFGQCRDGRCECYDPYDACGETNTCTLISSDPDNCGMCGRACAANEVCNGGDCECYPGFKRCNGVCVDTSADPANCGDCNQGCGNNACKNGRCQNNDDCGFGVFECRVNGGGTACVVPEWNPAFCDPNLTNACGSPCGPGQLCAQENGFSRFQCRNYRPARGCTSCPCNDCDGEFCLDPQQPPDVVYCITR